MDKQYDEIDLREYLEVVSKRWKLVLACTVSVAIAALILSALQKPVYDAKATFMVKASGNSGGMSQLAGLAGLAGVNLSAGGSDLNDLTTLVQSGAVAAKVAADLDLRNRIKGWNDPGLSEDQIAGAVKGMLAKPRTDGNLIEIKVSGPDPQLAADVANDYLEALSFYWNKLNVTQARKKSEYLDSQLPKVEASLKQAEERLKRFTLLQNGAAPAPLESEPSVLQPAGAQGIELARLNRELEIQNAVYLMLRKENAQVKLEEAKEIPPFSVIDRAEKPLHKSKPNAKFNFILGLLVGGFAGVFVAFFQEYWERSA